MKRQYAINVVRDTSAGNPWEDWDSEPPICVCHGRDILDFGVSDRCPDLTEKVVREHWREMLELIPGPFLDPQPKGRHFATRSYASLTEFARNEWDDRGYRLWERLAEAFQEAVNDLGRAEVFDELVGVYAWLGIRAYSGSTQGYSQGDYAEVLVVLTPEWCERMGLDPKSWNEADFRGVVKLYGAWAWGDVFSYVITTAVDAGLPDDEIEGVPVFYSTYGDWPRDGIDSCGGFYGADHRRSGLYESALGAIKCFTKADAKERAERAEWEARDVMTKEVSA